MEKESEEKKTYKVELQFVAQAHFHTAVVMDEETYQEFKSLDEDAMVSESTRPRLWALMQKAASDHDAFDHIEHDSDFEEVEVAKYKNFPFSNETY